MRRVLYILMISMIFLQAENITDIYRFDGIEQVRKVLDKRLKDPKYWLGYLKDYNTSCGYFESKRYLIKCTKEHKDMNIFLIDKGNVKKLSSYDIILGKDGVKKKEGDLITPIGAYKIVRKFRPKDSFYGPIAFALSYPNLYDRLHGRDGHGIWIHGYPIDDQNRSDTTKGCLVLKNQELKNLSDTIKSNKTFVIISENRQTDIKKETIAKILAFLYDWRESWARSEIDRYLSFYSDNFKRFDGKGIEEFSMMKRAIFSRKGKKSIIFTDISIIPYPNIKNKKLFRINFHEKYRAKGYKYDGTKELYIEISDNIKILVEK